MNTRIIDLKRNKKSLAIQAAIVLFVGILPFIIRDDYYVFLFTEILIYSLLTVTFNLMMGYTGMVSLGHAAYFGTGAYVTAILLKKFGWSSLIVVIILSILITAVIAAIVGFFCVKIAEIYFVFLTLAFGQVIFSISYYWNAVTDGSDGIAGVPRPLINFLALKIDLSSQTAFYYFVLILVAIGVSVCFLVVRSPFGGILQAIRENPNRVQFMGINVKRYKLQVFMLSSAFAGFAGSLYSIHQGFISPELLYWTKSAEVILMCLLGGIYKFFGPTVGSVIMIFLKDYILNFTEYWKLILGGLLIFIVLFTPKGILPILTELFLKLRGKSTHVS